MIMHSRVLRFAPLLLAILGITAAANADVTLYSDGAPNGTYLSWNITSASGFPVEDSFTLSSASTLTGVTFGNWLSTGGAASSVQWAIVSSEGSSTPACAGCSGTAALTPDGTFTVTVDPGAFQGVNQEFSLPDLSLSAGTYWLELQNESLASGTEGGWDMNSGPSMVWESLHGDQTGSNCAIGAGKCSDSFTIIGDAVVSATPELSSLALLGSAIIPLCYQFRRRRTH